MIGWIIFFSILIVLFLLSCIRLGGRAKYGEDGFYFHVFVGPFKIKLFPASSRENKRKPKDPSKTKKVAAQEEKEENKPGTVSRVISMLPTLAETAGGLKRRIRIDYLALEIIWGAQDAASAAINYGKANAAFGIIWPLLDNNFKVKKCDVKIDVNYNVITPKLTADASLSITIRQLFSFAVYYGVKILANWSRSGKSATHHQEV